MAKAPFMPLYTSDYLGDTGHLSTEEHGAYLLILMQMWNAGGALPADPSKLARVARCSTKKWLAMQDNVLAFFNIDGDQITNNRLTKERQKVEAKTEVRRSAGAKGGAAKALKTKEQPLANAIAKPYHSPDTITREDTTANAVVAHIHPEQTNTQKGKGKVRGAARGSRLSESWTPTLKDYAFAAKHNLTREEINREADKFRNHWTAATGKGSVKLDWEAAWRNWLIGDYGIVTKRAAAKPSVNGQNVGAFDRVVQRIHGALPGGEVTGHADFDSDDAGAIDGEYRIVPASEEPGADWQRGGSGEAAFGSLFAKGGS
jgi:uncharacterized protein YdaU (DUF1376 family)